METVTILLCILLFVAVLGLLFSIIGRKISKWVDKKITEKLNDEKVDEMILDIVEVKRQLNNINIDVNEKIKETRKLIGSICDEAKHREIVTRKFQ